MARNCEKMKEILEELDMREKIEAFEKEKIDLQCFLSLTENQLQRLGVTTLGDIHRLTSRVRSEMKKEEEAPGSSRETIKDERHTGTQSQHSQLLQQITNNRNVLFGRGKRGKKTKKSHGMPDFEEDLPSNKKTKRSFRSWTATVVCLPNKDTCRIPSTAEKETNFKAGLGAKRIKFKTSDNEEQVLNTIMSDEVVDNETVGFPALKNCGGFELLKCYQNCRELKNIECAWTVANLKTFLGCQSKLYVRPIQRNLSTEPITTTSDPNSQVRCEICQKSVSVRELRSHLKTCDLDSNDKSDNDESLYNPMLTKTDDVVQHVEENVEVDSMNVNDVCRDRPNGMLSQLSEVHLVDIQRTNIREESQEIPGTSNYIVVNIEEQTNKNQSGSSIEEECISIEYDNQNVDSPPTLNNAVDIPLGSQIAASCKEDNSVVDLDCTIEKIIESCLEKKIVDPVEILRFAQDKFLTGRQLDIQEDNMVTELEGDTNFILVDRNNILQTSFEEISEIKSGDIRKTLQVEFYGETAADFGGPRREFFRLVLTEIKTKYFEKGIREYLAADYVIVGKIMALSILQNGCMPSFMSEEILNQVFSTEDPGNPSLRNLRFGLDTLGLVRIGAILPPFLHLLRPNAVTLTIRGLLRIMRPKFSEHGSNSRLHENEVYSAFLKYVRSVASGRRGTISLQHILEFVTGASAEPVLGFAQHPSIEFVQIRNDLSFIPTANTCSNCMLLPRPVADMKLPAEEALFNLYDYAFLNTYYGLV